MRSNPRFRALAALHLAPAIPLAGAASASAATFASNFSSDPGGTALGIAEVDAGVLKLTDLDDLPPNGPPLTGSGAGACLPLDKPAVSTELHGSATVAGPYAIQAGAVVNATAKTITVPRTGNAMFYRIRGATAVSIQSVTIQGASLAISY